MSVRFGLHRTAVTVFLAVAGACGLFAQINTDRMMTLGRSALYFEDYVLSIQYFNQAINAKPYLNEPYFLRAVAKLSLEDYVGAENDCSRAISINPYVIDSYQVRGLARINQNKLDQAVEDYVTALKWDPENRAMRHNLILCYLKLGRNDEAQHSIDTLLVVAPRYTPAMAMQSHLLLEQKDTLGAFEILDKALAIDKYDASLLRDRGVLKAMMENYAEAEEDLDQALRYEPTNSDFYIDRALVRFYRNNLRGAMSDYDIAIETNPQNVLGHYNRGLLRAQIGDDNRAIEDFDVVIEAEPDNMMAVFNRGLLRDQVGDLSGAVQDYTTVLAEYPNFIYGYQLRAEARFKLGDRRGGEQDELKVIRSRTTQPDSGQDSDSEGQGDTDNSERTRKKSDRNVWNYRKIVVSESDRTEFASEYRGKVQNRNVDVQFMEGYQISWFGNPELSEIDREVRFSAQIESLNSSGQLPFRLLLANKEIPLDEHRINQLFEDVDRQSLQIAEDPENPYHYFARALDYYLLQDFDNAENDFTQTILSGSGLWVAYFGRSLVRMRKAEMLKAGQSSSVQENAGISEDRAMVVQWQMVLNDLGKVIDMEPDFAFAYYNKGTIEARQGDYRTAVADFSTAIGINDRFAEAYYNRGLSLIFLGRVGEGLEDLGKAGELGLYSAYNIMKRFSQQ